jgi:hypothetical protein
MLIMNRILPVFAIALFFSGTASAQFSKGTVLLGGTLAFSGSTSNNYSNDQNVHTGYFNISLGKAVQENTVIGISINYQPYYTNNYYYNNNQPAFPYSNNGYGAGIFYRKYKNLGKEFYIFGEAGAGYQGATQTGKNESGTKVLMGSSNGGNLYLMPGVAYKISKKFFLELTIPNIFYAHFSTTSTTTTQPVNETIKSNEFSVGTSLNAGPLSSVGIGFRLVL